MIIKTSTIKYSKLFNPIFIFAPFLLAYIIIARIGVYQEYYYPRYLFNYSFYYFSMINDNSNIIKSYFKNLDYEGIIGIIPEILLIVEIVVNKLIDLCYWLLIDKKRRIMIIN